MRRGSIRFSQQAALNAIALEEILAFDWHDLARFDPAAGAPLATIAEFCSICKAPQPFERDYLNTMAATAFFDGMDRMPYREMEVLHAFALHNRHGLDEVSERLVQSFARTAFGRGQMISRYSVDDAYSLTHALFYLTDFGGVQIEDRLASDEVERLRVHLIGLMVLMIRRDNGDVLGELLICWLMCRFQAVGAEAVVVDSAILQMLSLATPQGAVPPTRALRAKFLRAEVHFAEVYHTTLVAAILFRMLAVK